MSYRVLIHASELITGEGVRHKDGRKVQLEDMSRIPDGALVYRVKKRGQTEIPSRIEWVGTTSDLPKKWLKYPKKSLKQKNTLIPGLIDCHTHLVFAGNRSDEFAARCAGATYQEIAAKGGGIRSTVQATRSASATELERLASQRLSEVYSYGVRTIEIKSGYGLSFESEMKILQTISKLRKRFPQMTILSTFLGAHAFPADRKRDEYLKEILEQMLPEVAKKRLAESCDVFIDEGYYSLEEGRKILARAVELGLKIKVHADELINTESATLAASMNALSADHLLKISEKGIQRLGKSNTVAVLLPGTAFYLKAAYAPARKLIDAGACVALSTDFNPGTCMCLSLPTIMTIAALYLEMSQAEIFAAVTFNAAKALGIQNKKGTLEPGKDADFAVLPFSQFEEMYYRFSWNPVPQKKEIFN